MQWGSELSLLLAGLGTGAKDTTANVLDLGGRDGR